MFSVSLLIKVPLSTLCLPVCQAFTIYPRPNQANAKSDESTVLKLAAQAKQWDLLLVIADAGADVNLPVNGAFSSSKHT
jgi:hypothetical protein